MKILISLLAFFSIISCNDQNKSPGTVVSLPADSAYITIPHPPAGAQPRRAALPGASHRIYLNKGVDGGVWATSGAGAGDTLVIQAKQNPFTYAYFAGIQGADSMHPIVIVREGGQVQFSVGFAFGDGAKFIKVDGRGRDTKYGFYINQHVKSDVDAGTSIISLEGTPSDIRMFGFRGDSAQYGIWMKNEHFCRTELQSHVFNNCEFGDFMLTGIRQHGSYAGATEIENTTRPSVCDGANKFYTPSRLGNLKIHDGIIHNVGKNGLMISDARVGRSEIWNMDIDSTGRQLDPAQGHGIASGGASNLFIHDNSINNTWLSGIAAFGGADVVIENNVIGKSGEDPWTKKKSGWTEPIRSVTDPRISFKCKITIRGNIIGEGTEGLKQIGIYKGNYESVTVCNNGDATVFSDAGVNVISDCPKPQPVPVPVPKPTMVHQVTWDKKKYFMFSDSTWSSVNKK